MTLAERYIYVVYQKKSFSEAAKELFVSQPALSATVARAEKELGFRIFDRSTAPLTLTEQGRIYIDTLNEIEEVRHVMEKRLEQLAKKERHDVLVGGTIFVAQNLLPHICGEHLNRFPQTRFSVDMSIYETPMRDKLTAHTLHLMMVYSYDETLFSVKPLFEEQRVIAMRKELLPTPALARYALSREDILLRRYDESVKIDDLSLFYNTPFLPQRPDTQIATFTNTFLQNVPTSPHAIPTIPGLASNYLLMCNGLGAAITTDTIIAASYANSEDLIFFVPKTPTARATVSMIYAKNFELPYAAARFLETATEMCENGKILSLFHLKSLP